MRVFREREKEAARMKGILVQGAVLKKYNSMYVALVSLAFSSFSVLSTLLSLYLLSLYLYL